MHSSVGIEAREFAPRWESCDQGPAAPRRAGSGWRPRIGLTAVARPGRLPAWAAEKVDMADVRVDTVTGSEIRAAVEDLLPDVARRAEEISAARRLPAPLVRDLRVAGAFRIALPRARGGPEMTPREQVELVEMISAVDPSVGWCVMIGSDSELFGAFLEPTVAETLFADPDAICAGLAQPAGRATVVPGGFEVSGRWAFGSGCTHADVMVAGFLVLEGGAPRMRADGNPDWRIAVAPASSFEILDTWYTTGLAGSGSNDYTVDGLVVPVEHTFSFWESPQRPEPLYALPGAFLLNMPGGPLGLATNAIDVVRALSADKLVVPELVLMRDLVRVRRMVAQAETQLGAARLRLRLARSRGDVLQAGEEPDRELRAALTLARTNAFRTAPTFRAAHVRCRSRVRLHRPSARPPAARCGDDEPAHRRAGADPRADRWLADRRRGRAPHHLTSPASAGSVVGAAARCDEQSPARLEDVGGVPDPTGVHHRPDHRAQLHGAVLAVTLLDDVDSPVGPSTTTSSPAGWRSTWSTSRPGG